MRPLAQLVSLSVAAIALVTGCREQQSRVRSTVAEATSASSSDTGRTLDDAIASGGEVGEDPLSPDVPTGDTYAAQGRVDRGRQCLERGKRRGDREPDHVELHQAIAEYNKAIDLDPTLADAYCGRGDVSLELGQIWIEEDLHRANSALQDAVADYTKAIELDPDNLPAHLGRGSTHRTLGDYGPAMADFERALALDPGNEDARSRIAELKEEAGLAE
jgi:tetratricopeptide (TPR) repeat protein